MTGAQTVVRFRHVRSTLRLMDTLKLSKKQLLLFVTMVLVALGATVVLVQVRNGTATPTVDDYQALLSTPPEQITLRSFQRTFGRPTYQESVGGTGEDFTYYNFNPNGYKYPHQVWVDDQGNTLLVRVTVPEELREDERSIISRYLDKNVVKYEENSSKYGFSTIRAYPEQGQAFVIDHTTQMVVEWVFFPPMSVEAYQELFAHRHESDQDAP